MRRSSANPGKSNRLCAAAGLLLLIAAGLVPAGCSAPAVPQSVRVSGGTMGTTYQVTTHAVPDGFADEAAWQAAIDAVLEQVNDEMSTYREDSELSRFNAHESSEWFDVSAGTAYVTAAALDISQRTDGAFDPTVMPLVDLWAFGPEARPAVVPTDEEIAAARKSVGYEMVEVRRDPPALRKQQPGVRLDLSAIAKGYGVDQVAQLCEESGVRDYFIEIGGEVRTRGDRPGGGPWRVGLESPEESRRAVLSVLKVHNAAVATSGSYRNYFEQDGVRYSHTIDPSTGRPITHKLVSVTVVADDCTMADGWATALMVLGPEEGYNLAERENLAAQFMVATEPGFEHRTTSAFQQRRLTGEP